MDEMTSFCTEHCAFLRFFHIQWCYFLFATTLPAIPSFSITSFFFLVFIYSFFQICLIYILPFLFVLFFFSFFLLFRPAIFLICSLLLCAPRQEFGRVHPPRADSSPLPIPPALTAAPATLRTTSNRVRHLIRPNMFNRCVLHDKHLEDIGADSRIGQR